MPYKTWNIVKAGDEYRDKDGNNKRRWNPVGTLLFNEEKNSFSIRLNMFDDWFNCFENTYEKKERTEGERTEQGYANQYGGETQEKSKW